LPTVAVFSISGVDMALVVGLHQPYLRMSVVDGGRSSRFRRRLIRCAAFCAGLLALRIRLTFSLRLSLFCAHATALFSLPRAVCTPVLHCACFHLPRIWAGGDLTLHTSAHNRKAKMAAAWRGGNGVAAPMHEMNGGEKWR
jgi:hypothetical protein